LHSTPHFTYQTSLPVKDYFDSVNEVSECTLQQGTQIFGCEYLSAHHRVCARSMGFSQNRTLRCKDNMLQLCALPHRVNFPGNLQPYGYPKHRSFQLPFYL